jgi:hypothetical protein
MDDVFVPWLCGGCAVAAGGSRRLAAAVVGGGRAGDGAGWRGGLMVTGWVRWGGLTGSD